MMPRFITLAQLKLNNATFQQKPSQLNLNDATLYNSRTTRTEQCHISAKPLIAKTERCHALCILTQLKLNDATF